MAGFPVRNFIDLSFARYGGSKFKPVITVWGSKIPATGLTFEKLSGMETPYAKPADTYPSCGLKIGRNSH
jgi:hypothetical protein